MAPQTASLEVGVLGPTVAVRAGEVVRLGGPLPHRLLTVLLAVDGAPLRADALVEALWDGAPPREPLSSLQAYVSRLRTALGATPTSPVVVQQRGGYSARLECGSLDSERVEDLLAEAAAEPDPQVAAELSGRAVGLFRGRPFADAGDEGYAAELVAPARAFWAERLAHAVELQAAALVASGRPAVAVAGLRQHVRTDPLRERAWSLLVLALADSGERVGALAAVREARATLARELGVGPGRALTDLAAAIETADGKRLDEVRAEVLGRPPSTARVRTPPVAGAHAAGRLPGVGDAFVDRRAELVLLDELTRSHSLVTVSGPGGVGKTRLVVEWARRRARPAWFVPLAGCRGRNAVELAVCRAAGLEGIFDTAGEAVLRWAARREGVLVLDNCEHVLDEVRALVLALRRAAPALVVVATSRHGLDLAGEAVLGLTGLPAGEPSAQGEGVGPAVDLLVDRLAARRPGWTPSSEEVGDLRRLAAALDGLPLALELAAVRGRAQSIADLVDGVSRTVTAVDPVPTGSPSPHRTLAATIDWSLDLLPPDERELLLRLAPFAGGFTAEAATEVWGSDALPLLVDMVGRSVVQADPSRTPTRFSLLETMRSRCAEVDPHPEVARRRHAEWVERLAERWFERSQDDRSSEMARTLAAELPNITAALTHDAEHDPRRAVRTLAGLDCWWYRACLGDELMWWSGRLGPSASLVSPGLRVRLGLLHVVGLVMVHRDAEAHAALERLGPELDDVPPSDEDSTYVHLLHPYLVAMLALQTGDLASARAAALRAAALADAQAAFPWFAPVCRVMVAGLDLAGGDVDGAHSAAENCLAVLAAQGMRWGTAAAGRVLAMALLARGDHAGAVRESRAALRRNVEDHDVSSGLGATMVVARCLAACGEPFEAAVVADGMRAWARAAGARWDVVDGALAADLDLVLDALLTADERDRAAREGVGLGLAALQQRALGTVAPGDAARAVLPRRRSRATAG